MQQHRLTLVGMFRVPRFLLSRVDASGLGPIGLVSKFEWPLRIPKLHRNISHNSQKCQSFIPGAGPPIILIVENPQRRDA